MADLVSLIAEVLRPCALYGIDVEHLAGVVASRLNLHEERVRAAIERLHYHDGEGWCAEDGHSWPCPTIRAFDHLSVDGEKP